MTFVLGIPLWIILAFILVILYKKGTFKKLGI